MMYAQLDIWRSSAGYVPPTTSASSANTHKPVAKEDSLDISYVLNMLDDRDEAMAAAAAAASAAPSVSAASPFSDMASPAAAAALSPPPPPYPAMYETSNPVAGPSGLQQQQYFKSEPREEFSDEGNLTSPAVFF